jgi:hypothetical protein
MFTIPTFKPGQRVRLHYRPYEMKCPNCKENRGSYAYPFERIVTILEMPENARLRCSHCDYAIPMPDGFLGTIDDNGVKGAFPYTLLEPLEDDEDA